MVRRIRFIYGKSNSKFGKSPVNFDRSFWKVLEGSRAIQKFHQGRKDSTSPSRPRRGKVESQVDSTSLGRRPNKREKGSPLPNLV